MSTPTQPLPGTPGTYDPNDPNPKPKPQPQPCVRP